MISLEEAQQVINKEIDKFLLTNEPAELYNPINYVLQIGGKRLRPALVLMTCNIFSHTYKNAVNPALAIEVFHNFTLLHDDIMDNAKIRRNNQTVHEKWDKNTAILSGDAMLIKAYELLSGSEAELLPKLLPIFNSTALQVCEGQQFDMNYEKTTEVKIEEYLQMIELKTAVLIAASLKIGAICGHASEKDADLLYDVGKNIGIAFQLKDDLLDTYGDPDVFGKKIGGDIQANKKTFLYLKALELAETDDFNKLVNLFSAPNHDETLKIKSILEIFHRLNIQQETEDLVTVYTEKAMKNLALLNIPETDKTELISLFTQLLNRMK